MGSTLSTNRASATETQPDRTIRTATSQTHYEFPTDIRNSTSKDLSAPAHDTAAEYSKTGPRQLQLGPAPSPLSTFAERLDEALSPLTRGEPIDLARVIRHARPDLGTTLPSSDDQKPMPGPAGPGTQPLRHYVAVVTSKPVESPEGHLEGHLPALLVASKPPCTDAAAHGLFELADTYRFPPLQQIQDTVFTVRGAGKT